ncbi:MAG: YlxR family protein [Armatimonadota bacterium]
MTPRRVPVRTCVACRAEGGKQGLLRVVRDPATGEADHDPTGKRAGRGAYVCPALACVDAARKRKALERSLKVSACAPDLFERLATAARAAESATSGNPSVDTV